VNVHDAIDAIVVILQGNIIFERAQVIAQVSVPGGADAGKDAAFFSHTCLVLLLYEFFNQTDHLARFGVATGLEFGIDQRAIYLDLEPASVRGKERQAFDLRFELLEQVICQAHGPVSVMSDCTISDTDCEHVVSPHYIVGKL
jgi:hypothetical protein